MEEDYINSLSERLDSCTLIWNPRDLTIDDLAKFTSLLADIHREVAVPYVTEAFYPASSNRVPAEPPLIARMSMGSPLVTQLLAGSGGILSLGMVGFILKNPDKLGEFLPRIRQSWHESNTRALEAKIQYVEERLEYVEARARVQTRGRSIERFEKTREQRMTRERTARDRRRDDRPGRSR